MIDFAYGTVCLLKHHVEFEGRALMLRSPCHCEATSAGGAERSVSNSAIGGSLRPFALRVSFVGHGMAIIVWTLVVHYSPAIGIIILTFLIHLFSLVAADWVDSKLVLRALEVLRVAHPNKVQQVTRIAPLLREPGLTNSFHYYLRSLAMV